MNWDQIKIEWAAMARRVRSDLPHNARLAPGENLPASRATELKEPQASNLNAADAR